VGRFFYSQIAFLTYGTVLNGFEYKHYHHHSIGYRLPEIFIPLKLQTPFLPVVLPLQWTRGQVWLPKVKFGELSLHPTEVQSHDCYF